MLKDLYRMAVFAKVIEHGSFSKAAAALNLGKSVVSQHVAVLERSLGVQLVHRSTRSLAMTEEGRDFHARCRQILEVAEGALADVDARKQRPAGRIRVTASYNLGVSFVISRLCKFKAIHPDVDFDLVLDDTVVNLIEEGFDLALRVGRLSDTRLHAVPLAPCRMVLCASPAYLARRPRPRSPADLVHHPWISITQLTQPDRVKLVHKGGRRATVRIREAVRTNTGIAARSFLLEGAGIGIVPDYAVTAELESGALVELLPDWHEARDHPISAIFPSKDNLPLKTRLLIDFLKAEFKERYGGSGAGAR